MSLCILVNIQLFFSRIILRFQLSTSRPPCLTPPCLLPMFGWLSTTWGVMCIDSFSFSSSRRSYILSLQTGVLALGHIAGSRLWRPSGVPKRIQRAGALMCYWPGKLDSIIIIHWMHIHSRPNQHELPWGTHPLDTTRPGPYRYIYIYVEYVHVHPALRYCISGPNHQSMCNCGCSNVIGKELKAKLQQLLNLPLNRYGGKQRRS